MRYLRFVAATVVVAALGMGCVTSRPDLMVAQVTLDWSTKTVAADVANIGNEDAKEFLVYFNGDENPESSNHRPQVSKHVAGLNAGETIHLKADFAPLAHSDNALLARVYMITVLVDPKGMVEEHFEDNNRKRALVPNPNQSKPDLIVVDIVQDGPYYLVVEYANVGGASSEFFHLNISASGGTFPSSSGISYDWPVPTPLEIKRTGGFTIGLIGLSTGMTDDVTSEVDWDGLVTESREDNNTLTKRVRIE